MGTSNNRGDIVPLSAATGGAGRAGRKGLYPYVLLSQPSFIIDVCLLSLSDWVYNLESFSSRKKSNLIPNHDRIGSWK